MSKLKKEDIFYTMLKDFAATLVEAAEIYVEILENYPVSFAKIPKLKVLENKCDDKVKKIMHNLYASFITPIDREDISELAMSLDDVMDEMNGVVLRLDLFGATEMRMEGPQMGELTLAAVREMKEMFDHLPNYKNDAVVMEKAIAVSHIEDEGDRVYHNAIRRLFQEEEGGKVATSWLRLFDRMEYVLNSCDHVCIVVRSVVLKSA